MFYHLNGPISDIPSGPVLYEVKNLFGETLTFLLRNACCMRFLDMIKEPLCLFMFDEIFRDSAIFLSFLSNDNEM